VPKTSLANSVKIGHNPLLGGGSQPKQQSHWPGTIDAPCQWHCGGWI